MSSLDSVVAAIAAASGFRPSAWVASAAGLEFDAFFGAGFGAGVLGLTEVAPCAGSDFGEGTLDTTRFGDHLAGLPDVFLTVAFLAVAFLAATFLGATFFGADFFVAVFFVAADAFFTAGFFVAAFFADFADFFAAGFAAFFAAGLLAFLVADFFTAAFFAAGFLVADFAAAAGLFFFFASAASLDEADLLALVDLAFAVLPAAFFAAGLAVNAFGLGDERFMVNSSGRWT